MCIMSAFKLHYIYLLFLYALSLMLNNLLQNARLCKLIFSLHLPQISNLLNLIVISVTGINMLKTEVFFASATRTG